MEVRSGVHSVSKTTLHETRIQLKPYILNSAEISYKCKGKHGGIRLVPIGNKYTMKSFKILDAGVELHQH
uniref:Uncharacterized protein n=1 Tax=Anguilla anguilla TaxID=7936 RepID=A0A0E9WJW0_ANGAN